MDINVVGRQTDVTERFRRHLEEKLEKVSHLAPSAQRVDVEISSEKNPRRSDESERVELTVHDDGAVIRAEARSDDLYGALDRALARLSERLRRLRDRRKDHRRGRTTTHSAGIESVRTMDTDGARVESLVAEGSESGDAEFEDDGGYSGESPIVIREKSHPSRPMSIDEALYEMELVGHDFYLFMDEATSHPKVVYRRKGWNYGVIELADEETDL